MEFINYLETHFGNPLCACGCGKKVNLHKRKMQFNFFADGCTNKNRYNSPSCVEFYLFRGYDTNEIPQKITNIQNNSRSIDIQKILDKNKKILSSSKTSHEISKILNISTKYIQQYRKQNNIIYKPKKLNINMNDLISFFKNNTISECAKKYNCSTYSIINILNKAGIDTSIHNGDEVSKNAYRRWHNKNKKQIIDFLAKIRSKQRSKISSLQNILYSILDDLNITYCREYQDKDNDPETIIGPYNFDCVIPLKNKKLLIECQGDYWHSLPQVVRKDKAKNTYIEKYCKNCEIKYLWEHEFKCKDKIVELIKYWVGITKIETINFNFNDIEIKKCEVKDYKPFLSKYHYLSQVERGGITYGAYFNNKLIAVCSFSSLIRQNLPHDPQTTRELSRLCIHPRYQKKNFASWFVSRCIKSLDAKYKTIISYCDTTFNHNGAVYKACNFKLDGEIKPDYWYMSEDGWVMHKKTLYNHAKKMKTKEKEYAKLNGYKKVYGLKKFKFIYER